MTSLSASSEPPRRALSAALRLLALSLLLGPVVSFGGYLVNRLLGGDHAWELPLSLLLLGLPLGLAAALARGGAHRLGGDGALWRWAPLAGIACALLAGGASLLAAFAGAFPRERLLGLPALLLALAVMTLALRHRPQGRVERQRGALLASGLAAAAVLWLMGNPEGLLRPAALGIVVGFGFVILALALLLDLALRSRLPAAIDLACLLLVGIAAVRLAPDAGRSTCEAVRDAAPASGGTAAASGAPNVVLIVLDTVGRHHLSLYGYERPTTPFLEELAREAAVYTRAVSVAPWTLPAHASMFTGLYPRAHGAHLYVGEEGEARERQYHSLPSERTTLAEILSARGYQTGAVAANGFWMGRRTNLAQGFDTFCEEGSHAFLREGSGVALHDLAVRLAKSWAPPSLAYHWTLPTAPAGRIVRRALDWVDGLQEDAPFFLLLNFMDAHEPYLAAPGFRDRFPGFQRRLFPVGTMELWTRLLREGRPLAAEERDHILSQYDGSLLYLDAQLRGLVQGMMERGLLDRSLLIITSDHGEAFGAHGLLGHQALSYETSDIPLLIRYPGGARAGVEVRRFENRELFHLILSEVGAAPSPEARGWQAAAEQHPYRPAQAAEAPALARLMHAERALWFDALVYRESDDGRAVLFDLDSDPRERHDLAAGRPAEIARGHALLGQFLAQVPEGAPEARTPAAELSAEERERLKALGYVQ